MGEHATLAPSSAARWLVCPASATAESRMPSTDTEHSLAGTARHSVAAIWLRTGSPPAVGTPLTEPPGVLVTEEMIADATAGVRWVLDYCAAAGPHNLMVEEKIEIGHAFGLEKGKCFGTADVLILSQEEMVILDHKFGYADVQVAENKQLTLYAVGAMEECGWLFPRVRFVINQPKGAGITNWVITKEDLLQQVVGLREKLLIAASDTAPYVPDDDACRFCKAAGVCKALQEKTLALAKAEFDTPAAIIENISMADLTTILERTKLIEGALKAAWEHALSLAQSGVKVPGYKVVAARKNRVWENEQTAESTLKMLGYKEDDLAPRKFLSPAQAEKLAGEKVVAGLTKTPQGEPVLAPESDKRPEYKPFEDTSAVQQMLE